ncbi:unnamed protein product [Caenorhabditis brenneri]
MERETKEAICWLACILIILTALISVRMFLTPEDTIVDVLPDISDWKELQLKEVRKQFKLISFGLKRKYLKFLKNLMKPSTDIDRYFKKHYREIKEIKVVNIAKDSSMNGLKVSLLICQGKEEVVAKITVIPNKKSPTEYMVDEGIICSGSDCSD